MAARPCVPLHDCTGFSAAGVDVEIEAVPFAAPVLAPPGIVCASVLVDVLGVCSLADVWGAGVGAAGVDVPFVGAGL